MSIDGIYTPGWITERNTGTNIAGIVTPAWSEQLSDVRAHVRQLSGREVSALDRRAILATHRIYTKTGQDIISTDRMLDPSGQIFRITNIDNPHGQDHHLQIDCTRGKDEREQE